MKRSFFATAFTAGLIAGTLDIIAAAINYYIKTGKDPIPMLKGIAYGAIGSSATKGGIEMALLGLLIHFFIAMAFTFLFFLLAKQIPALVKIPLPIGVVYGILVWAAMRFIILPNLSHIKQKPIVGQEAVNNAIISAAIIVVCVGLPVAFLARRYVKANTLT